MEAGSNLARSIFEMFRREPQVQVVEPKLYARTWRPQLQVNTNAPAIIALPSEIQSIV